MSDDYTLMACSGATAPAMIEFFDVLPDCGHICGGGKCVPDALATSAASILPPCEDGASRCIPLAIAATGGAFEFMPCVSAFDLEMKGACVPKCLAGEFASALPRDICGEGEVCAPCVSPLTMQSSGACDLPACPGGGYDAGADTDGG